MKFVPNASPALASILQVRIEAEHPEANRLGVSYIRAEGSRRFHRTHRKDHPEDEGWAADYEKRDAADAKQAEAALRAYLIRRGETAATVRQLVADLASNILNNLAWTHSRAVHDIAQWFRHGMSHEEFADYMGGGLMSLPRDAEIAFWRKVCPNMTFDEVVAYFDRNLDWARPDGASSS